MFNLPHSAYQRVSVKEDALLVLCEAPAMDLCEGDAELWPLQQGEVCSVTGIQDIHCDNLREYCTKTVSVEIVISLLIFDKNKSMNEPSMSSASLLDL